MSEKVTKDYLFGLANTLASIDLADASVKTAYWLSRNGRILAPYIKELEELRTEVSSTPVFKQFHQELEAAGAADDKESAQKLVQDKYKEVIDDGNKELQDLASQLVDIPDFYKLPIDAIVGIAGKYIPQLFPMIED